MHFAITHRATSLPLEACHPSILTGYSLMLRSGTLCRVTTHDLRAHDTVHLARRLVEVLPLLRERLIFERRCNAMRLRVTMGLRVTKLRSEAGWELAVMSKTGQHRIGTAPVQPSLRFEQPSPRSRLNRPARVVD